MPPIPESLEDYKPQSVLGHGKFSTVIKAYDKLNSNYVAIKIITKSDTITKINKILPISSSSTNYDNEIKVIENISTYQHPNVVNYLNIFQSDSSIYIIQELSIYGELNPSNFKYPITNLSNQSIETVILSRLLNMLSSIQFLHSLDIIHRDIKPSNFLIFDNGIVKLTDFDTCYTLTNDPVEDKHQLYSKLIGTPLFLPPELLTHQKPVDKINNTSLPSKFNNFSKKLKIFDTKSKSLNYNPYMLDLWSLGITLHYLFYSIYPFYADNEFTLLHKIATVEPNTPKISELSFKIDPEFPIIKIIDNLLIKSPYKRWNVHSILKELNLSSSALLTSKSLSSSLKFKSSKSSKSSKPIKLHKSKSMDLLISDLSEPQNDTDEDEDYVLTSIFTKRTSKSTDKGKSTQQFKFQLPIFMSPKDVISSQWRDTNLINSKMKTKSPIPGNNQMLSSTSLPNPPMPKNKLAIDTKLSTQGQQQDERHDHHHYYEEEESSPTGYPNILNNLESLNTNSMNEHKLKSKSTQSSPIDPLPPSLSLLKPPPRSLLSNDSNRLSIHTLPELQSNANNRTVGNSLRSKNGSIRSIGLKHSELINFKTFKHNINKEVNHRDSNNDNNNNNNNTNNPNKTTNNPNNNTNNNNTNDDVDDVELGNNYRLYTMDDYLDKL